MKLKKEAEERSTPVTIIRQQEGMGGIDGVIGKYFQHRINMLQ